VEPDGDDSIPDDELVYRRIPAGANPILYDPSTEVLSDQSFAPHKKNDNTGLSVSLARSKSIDAMGKNGKPYYVAVFLAGDLKKNGIEIKPEPETEGGYDPAHAVLPNLNSANRKATETLEIQQILVSLCIRIEGPFVTPEDE